MEELRFQIRFTDKSGCGSYVHFNATKDNAQEVACQFANEHLKKEIERPRYFFQPAYKPFKTIAVVQWDKPKNQIVKKGLKFKLKLGYITYKFRDGSSETNYWYDKE